jgi:hypothetical protein
MDRGILNTFTDDDCCGDELSAASLRGILDVATSWLCPLCGMEWRCEVYQLDQGEGIRHWSPHCPIAIIS